MLVSQTRCRQFGTIPICNLENSARGVMLLNIRDNRRWFIPKGWPLPGYSYQTSSLIETFEEAGLRGKIIGDKRAGTYSFRKFEPNGSSQTIRVGVFFMAVDQVLNDWPKRGQLERQWFNISEATDLVEEPGLAQIIKRASTQTNLSVFCNFAAEIKRQKSLANHVSSVNVVYPNTD